MTKNKNKKSSEAAKQEAFKLSDGICYCKTPAMDAKERSVQQNLTGKYNMINSELQQINQEIGKIEPRKKENDATCSSIKRLEEELEGLRKRLYSNTNQG